MSSAWEAFVKKAIEGEPDDPFVTMLRRSLASGSKVMRINFKETPKGSGYRVLLSKLRELSSMEIPHSPSFTRWSFETGARMASIDEEAQRFAVIAEERFESVVEELSADVAKSIFFERVNALQPARTIGSLANMRAKRLEPGRAQKRAARFMNSFLGSLAYDLSKALHYSEKESAEIVDKSLTIFAPKWVSGEERKRRAVG